jgi:hypothetical protein
MGVGGIFWGSIAICIVFALAAYVVEEYIR